ncbi:hypothetical protein EI555_015778 [Monodon monoceros]|uniref:Uncharacterized protein n=1 Tax=Monodon monoceros TaxID=40151 RepID=A0A4U1EKB3_MONMO|nr:hypothetical protein EI555_015778 [Monodon monoceros]
MLVKVGFQATLHQSSLVWTSSVKAQRGAGERRGMECGKHWWSACRLHVPNDSLVTTENAKNSMRQYMINIWVGCL